MSHEIQLALNFILWPLSSWAIASGWIRKQELFMKSGFCTFAHWLLIFAPRSDLLTAVFSLLDRWRFSSETKSTFIAAIVFFSVFHVLWLLQDSENGVALFIHRSERCLFFWSLDIFVQFFLRSHIFCSISGCLPFLGSRDQTYVLSNLFKANSANRRSCYVESRELRKKWLEMAFILKLFYGTQAQSYWLSVIMTGSNH